jgi:hypothetical protein
VVYKGGHTSDKGQGRLQVFGGYVQNIKVVIFNNKKRTQFFYKKKHHQFKLQLTLKNNNHSCN